MNPEIYTILDDMKIRRPKKPIANSDIQTYLQVENSNLLVLLAEENEKAARKIEKLTNVLIALTVVIAILTATLVFLEFRPKSEKHDQDINFKTETKQQSIQTNKMKTFIPTEVAPIDKTKKSINHK
jgi:hypothetical protein